MIVDLYSLFLFTFKDDAVVFDQPQLDAFSQAIFKELNCRTRRSGSWYMYDLTEHHHVKNLHDMHLTHAELGYYHHRLIFHFRAEIDPGRLREVRDTLQSTAKRIADDHVIPAMKKAAPSQGDMIKGATTYPLTVVRAGWKERLRERIMGLKSKRPFPYTEETTSLSFEVLEPFGLSARRHLLRISMGGTALYMDSHTSLFALPRADVGAGLKRDLINGVYQHCLYPTKLKDRKDGKVDEELLMRLWEHILNTTGGSTAQLTGATFSQKSLVLALLGVMVSVIALNFWK